MDLEKTPPDYQKVLERLEKHEQRLDQQIGSLERQLKELQNAVMAARALRRPWRQRLRSTFLQPPLWKFEQHPPRPLRPDPSYLKEVAPSPAPRIGLVTPSYNQARFVGETINSVLSQNYPNLGYVLQDGNSKDGTVELLKTYGDKLRWYSEDDQGQVDAINRGFEKLDADIYGYINSDDVLLPGSLAYVARAFAKYPDVDIVYGHRIFINEPGDEIGRAILPPHDDVAIQWADYIPQETMFWRKRVWDKVKPFDLNFHYALDWDFILRAQAAGFNFLRLPRFIACFRVHSAQKTSAMYDVGSEEMRRLRLKYLKRVPSQLEIGNAIKSYLLRQYFTHWCYKAGILKY